MKRVFCNILFFITLSLPLGAVCQTANSYFDAGEQKFRLGDYQGAFTEYTRCLDKNKTFYEAFYERARCLLMMKKPEQAITDLGSAIRVNPDYYEAYLLRGQTYSEQKQAKSALADFEKAIGLKPSSEAAFIGRASHYIRSESWKDALKDLNTAVKLNTSSCAALLMRAEVLRHLKKNAEAISDYSGAVQCDPLLTEAYLGRAELYYFAGKYSEATDDLQAVIRSGRDDREITTLLAYSAFNSDDFDVALESFGKLQNVFGSRDAIIYFKKGICEMRLGRQEEALKDLNKAVALDSRNDTASVLMAEIYLSQSKPKNAQLCYNKALNTNPANAAAYAGRGKIYLDQNRPDLAISDYDLAIKLKPEADYYFMRAACKDVMKDSKGMCEDLTIAAGMGHAEAKRKLSKVCPR